MSETEEQKIYGIFKTSAGRTLSKRLHGEGRKVLEFEPYKIVQKEFEVHEDEIINGFLSFDWLVFPHPAAARIFLEIIKSKKIDLYDLDEIRVCVLGEMVSDVLRFEQIHTDLIFKAGDNLSFLLSDFSAHDIENLPRKILVFGSLSDLPIETAEFDEHQFKLSFLEICRIIPEQAIDYARQKALLTGGAVDEFIITSPDDLLFLKEIYRGKGKFVESLDFTLSAADAGLLRFLKDNNFPFQFLK